MFAPGESSHRKTYHHWFYCPADAFTDTGELNINDAVFPTTVICNALAAKCPRNGLVFEAYAWKYTG